MPLWDDNGELAPPKTPLVSRRRTLFRAYVRPQRGYAPRRLGARLLLQTPNGQRIYTDQRPIDRASSAEDLDSTFQFVVDAKDFVSGLRYHVELVECGQSQAAPPGENRAPSSDESTPLETIETGGIRVAFVPVIHDEIEPDLDEVNLARYADFLERMFPVVQVETQVLSPIDSGQDGSFVDLNRVLDLVHNRRLDDEPPDDLYYYGLIRPVRTSAEYCNEPLTSCVLGVAFESTSPFYRTGVGVDFSDDDSAATFVHELGHAQGLSHAPCKTEGDPKFPYSDGSIGVLGLDPFRREVRSPRLYKDVMSYCDPVWVSDYSYAKVASVIQAIHQAGPETELFRRGTPSTTQFDLFRIRDGVPQRGPRLRDVHLPDSLPLPAQVYGQAGEPLLTTTAYRINVGDSDAFDLLVPSPEWNWGSVEVQRLRLSYR